MIVFIILLALFVGVLIAAQPAANALLGRHLATPFQAAFMNFFAGMSVLLVINLAIGRAPPPMKDLANVPWPLWIAGGSMGAFFVTASLWGLPKIGATAWIAVVLTAQLATSVALDQFGLMGLERRPADPIRFLGLAILATGAFIVVARR